MSAFKKLGEAAKRAGAVAGIINHLVGSTQAPPPSQMPDYLSKQYADHTEQRLEEQRRNIKRLTTKDGRPVPTLDPRTAKQLRGK